MTGHSKCARGEDCIGSEDDAFFAHVRADGSVQEYYCRPCWEQLKDDSPALRMLKYPRRDPGNVARYARKLKESAPVAEAFAPTDVAALVAELAASPGRAYRCSGPVEN